MCFQGSRTCAVCPDSRVPLVGALHAGSGGLCVQGYSCRLGLVPGVLGSVGRSCVLEVGGSVGVCLQQLLIGYKLKVKGVGPRTGGSREKLLQLCLRVWGWEGGGSMRSSPGHQENQREACFWRGSARGATVCAVTVIKELGTQATGDQRHAALWARGRHPGARETRGARPC